MLEIVLVVLSLVALAVGWLARRAEAVAFTLLAIWLLLLIPHVAAWGPR